MNPSTLTQVKKYMPKTTTDLIAFIFLLCAIHGIALFEMFIVLPSIYSNVEHVSNNNGSNLYNLHVFVGVIVYINVMLNLYKIMTTNTTTRGMILPCMLKPEWKFCSVCECNAPPRSFHCFTCNSCILMRDHHCTFTGNCIGLHNRRFYINLLAYLLLAAVYSCGLNSDFMYHLFGSLSWRSFLSIMFPMVSWIFIRLEHVSNFQVLMCSLCLVGALLSGGLLVYHSMNIIHGQIVYERSFNITTYNLGWKENIALVFGTNWKFAWVCSLIPSPIPSDGLGFVTKNEYEGLKTM